MSLPKLLFSTISALLLVGCAQHPIKEDAPVAAGISKGELTVINQHWNYLVQYKEDTSADHWQSPIETKKLGTGDCEDIGIAKMLDPVILKSLPSNQIRLSYVHTPEGQPHMVLVIGKGKNAYVLDNLNDGVKLITETDYTPIYQLDVKGRVYQNGIWLKSHPKFKKFESILAQLKATEQTADYSKYTL